MQDWLKNIVKALEALPPGADLDVKVEYNVTNGERSLAERRKEGG